MPVIAMSGTLPADLEVDALAVGMFAGADRRPVLAPGAESLDAATGSQLAESLALLDASGVAGEVARLVTFGRTASPLILAVGLGAEPLRDRLAVSHVPTPQVDYHAVRAAAAEAVRALAGKHRVGIALPLLAPGDPELLGAVAEGALLGAYGFAGFHTVDADRRPPVSEIVLLVSGEITEAHHHAVGRARSIAAAAWRARDWVNTPANRLQPAEFADSVAAAARDAGLAVEILDETALMAAGYGGILAVGAGSCAPPRLVRLTYRPDLPGKAGPLEHLALVGKGITFDAGGLSLKPPQGMWAMKTDMAGAAAVAAAMIAVAAFAPRLAVTAYLPMAENLPGGRAYRPGDVVTMYRGRTVEILNTDAEGRLIVADAITRAREDGPDFLVEVSTLTGNGALGKSLSGVMGDDWLVDRVVTAGKRVGESMWPMPLPDDVRKSQRSKITDSLQMSSGMDWAALMSQGGCFLAGFVPEGMRWVHLDIAGQTTAAKAAGVLSEGATGIPVRTLLQLIIDLAAGTDNAAGPTGGIPVEAAPGRSVDWDEHGRGVERDK